MTLRSSVIKGLKWSTISAVYIAVLQIAQLSILTRLLSSSDFGLIAIVMVIIGFSNMFLDMGVSNVIIYKQHITESQLSSLYWFNVITGMILYLIVFSFSSGLADFYDAPELRILTLIVGLTLIIQPFGQQFSVLKQKNLEFDKLARIQISAKTISFLSTAGLAWFGFGVYSIAYGAVVFSIINVFLLVKSAEKEYRPRLVFNVTEIKEFYSFGLFQLGEKLINYVAGQLDVILIGRLLGLETLGIYNVAKNLVARPANIINPIITKVTFPVMAKVNQDKFRIKEIFFKTISYVTALNAPIYALIVLFARPLIELLFGDGWLDAVLVVQILSLGYVLSSIGNPSGSLLLSQGKAKTVFYWNALTFILYPVTIYIGSCFDIEGVASAFVLLHLILIYPNWKYVIIRVLNVSFMSYARNFISILVFSMILTFSLWLIQGYIGNNVLLKNLMSILTFGVIYFYGLRLFRNDLLQELMYLFKQRVNK